MRAEFKVQTNGTVPNYMWGRQKRRDGQWKVGSERVKGVEHGQVGGSGNRGWDGGSVSCHSITKGCVEVDGKGGMDSRRD